MQLSPAFGVLYMDISIKSYQASIPEKPPVQEILRHKGTGNSTGEHRLGHCCKHLNIQFRASSLCSKQCCRAPSFYFARPVEAVT